MSRPNVFPTATKLYHPTEGERIFPAGETDPGPMWRDRPGMDVISDVTKVHALQDLIQAQEAMDEMETRLMAASRDIAEAAGTRDAAVAKLHELEQAVIAEKARADEAEKRAKTYMGERDQARAELQAAQADKKPVKA